MISAFFYEGFGGTTSYGRQNTCVGIAIDGRQYGSLSNNRLHIHWPCGAGHLLYLGTITTLFSNEAWKSTRTCSSQVCGDKCEQL